MKNVLIIGGGVTGVLSAWELARAGHSVTLVEARALGNGSSSRSAAAIRAQFDSASTVRGLVYAERFYADWPRLFPGSQPCMKRNGYLFLNGYAADPEAIRATVELQRAAGLAEVEFLDKTEVDKRWPFIDTTCVATATWCPSDGFLFPAVIYQDGAEAARALGATIIQNDPVVGAEMSGARVAAVRLASGRRIEAEVFVNATGFMANATANLFGCREMPIKAERRYLYFLSGLKADSEWGLSLEEFPRLPMIVSPTGAYCRPENTQLMTGWLQFARPVAATLDNQDEVEPCFGLGLGEYGPAVRKEIAQVLPAVEDMGRLEAVTTGFYDATPDHNPLIGYDGKIENLVHAVGMSGHGVMHAPFSALIVAELVGRGRDASSLDLPLGLGAVDLGLYALDRTFDRAEGMVI